MHARTFLLLLLLGGATLHAGTTVDPPGSLQFSLEIHPGKGDWIQAHLNAKGFFMVRSEDKSSQGSLPAQESLRIFAEFEKLCTAAGVDGFPSGRRAGGRAIAPCFHYESPQGKMLHMEGRETPPPPELTAFMITLTQKLLHHATKTPRPAAAPPPPIRTF